MKLRILLTVAGLTCGLLAEDWPGGGVFTAETVDDFGAADVPFTLGAGLVKYTGPTATLQKGMTFSPTNGLPAILRVVDADATLTIGGNVNQTSGSFVKDGPGTLVFGGLTNVVGKNRFSEKLDSYPLVIDETTGLSGTNGYAVFTVNDGRVIMGGPGVTNTTTGVSWVGSRTQKSTRLDIVGGRHVHANNWFCISRGAGTTNNDVTAEVYISGGANVSLPQVCLNNSNGQSGYYGRSLLHVSNATVAVGSDVFVGEGTGEPKIYIGPDASMTVGRTGKAVDDGFQIGRRSDARADVTVDGGTLAYHVGYVRKGSKLTVKNGGTVKMDYTLKDAVSGKYGSGVVEVDGGTFMPWTTAYTGIMSDWFLGSTNNFVVGAGGATLQTPGFTHLGPQPTVGAAGATITKTGAGVLTMRPTAVPVAVQAGTLRMSMSPKAWTNGLTGTITTADGAALEVSGDTALGAMKVASTAATFDASGLERYDAWTLNDYAKWRPDGVIQSAESIGSRSSAIVFNNKIPVDRSFDLAFDAFLYYNTWDPADCWTLYFQNTSTTYRGNGQTGYIGVTNSFGVAVDVYTKGVRWCVDGAEALVIDASNSIGVYGDWYNRRRCRFAYDAENHRATFTMRRPDGVEDSWSYDVDLASVVGANESYFGFCSGTGGASAAFSFANVRFVEAGTSPAHVRVGGVKTLAAGETFTATTHPSETQNGFLMARLDAAEGATLDIEDDLQAAGFTAPARLTTDDPSLWTLARGAYWREDGSLATSRLLDGTMTPGSATSVARYPIGGNWESSFTYELGAHTDAPADALQYKLVGSGGNLEVQIRYYEDYTVVDGSVTNKMNTRKTQVKLYTRGNLSAQSVKDFDPIDVVKYGAAKINLAYDDTAKTLAVAMTQQDGARSNCVVFTDVDMETVMKGGQMANVVLYGLVGGLYSENVVRDFTFRSDSHDACLAKSGLHGFFGFEKINAAGTLVKTGSGDLGLVDTQNADVALRLAGGGIYLRREPLEDVTVSDASGWNFSNTAGCYVYPGGVQIGEYTSAHRSNVQLRHRVCVDGDWRCSFSLWMNSGWPADDISFFLHNDPRGDQCTAGGLGGCNGIANCAAIGWYFYPGNTVHPDTVTVAQNGGSLNWNASVTQSTLPLKLPGHTTDVVLTYDATAKTLTSVMTQGSTSVTNTFTDFDVAGSVKDSYAWLGFGLACGGAQATPRFMNFKFEHLENADLLASSRYLASVDVTADAAVRLDTAKTDGTFRLADAVTLAAGKTLTAESCSQAATLAMGTLTLGEGCVLAGDNETVLAPDALAGSLDALTVSRLTLAVPSSALEAHALKNCDLALSDNAKIAVPAGRPLSLRHVAVDGVQVSNGTYTSANADWVASGTVVLGGGTYFILR